jgi:hypothetical protein
MSDQSIGAVPRRIRRAAQCDVLHKICTDVGTQPAQGTGDSVDGGGAGDDHRMEGSARPPAGAGD